MKNKKWIALVLMLTISLNILSQSQSYAKKDYDAKIKKAEQQSKKYNKKSKKYEKKANEAKDDKEDSLKEIERIDKKIETAQKSMSELETEIQKAEAALIEEQSVLDLATQDAQNQYDIMKKRIKYMYENGNQDYIDIIFSSKNISELLNNAEYVEKISEYDKGMFVRYRDTLIDVNNKKVAVEDRVQELKEKKQEQSELKYDLQEMKEEKKGEMKKYEIDEKKNQEIANKYAKEAAKAEDEVNNLLALKQQEIERENGESVPSSAGFIWPLPVKGRISSKFGHRSSPTAGASTYHKGLDIAVPSGTSIKAAAAGKVVTAQYSASAGNYIMISHGKRTYTVYMHCSRLAVSEGDQVTQGQVIGFAGSTGISTGSHLHFGVSVNGNYVNPLGYVTQPK